MKICSKCKVEKPFESFYRDRKSINGYISACIDCIKLRRLELKKNPLMQLEKQIRVSVRLENRLLERENKRLCKRCKEIFLIDDLVGGYICKECNTKKVKEYIEKNKEYYKEYRSEYMKDYGEKNKEKIKEHNKEYGKEYREKNKEKLREYRIEHNKEYYEKNKEKLREYDKEYRKKNKEKKNKYLREYRLKKKLEKQNNT